MRIVVSGTHASGKSTLISDFVARHPEFAVLPDPFELIDEEWDAPEPAMFAAQLRVAAERLREPGGPGPVIAERGPLDFVAYLRALGTEPSDRMLALAADAMSNVDLLVVLPLTGKIGVGDEEYPELREAMNDALLDLLDDPDLLGDGTTVLELAGDAAARLAVLESAAGVRFGT